MTQAELFNPARGNALRDAGIDAASNPRAEQLAIARMVAETIANNTDGTCTADQVQKVMIERGINLGNAAGGIFKSGKWAWTGRIANSSRTSNHSRIMRIWELKK